MTNKIVLRSVEEFMADYTPVYQPLYPLFLGKAKSYDEQVGTHDFKRVDTVGDIRAKHITPKDTEIKQVNVKEGKKTFKKYFLANQYIQSNFQDTRGNEDVVAQVLDEHQKQADEMLLLGDGTSVGNVVNNGLFWSADSNYSLKESVEVAAGTASDHLKDMHTKIMVTCSLADNISGRKLLIVYGETACAKFDSLYANTDAPFKRVLSDVLGSNWTVVKMPKAVTPTSTNGWITVNLDQIMVHYTTLPSLKAQGVNEEKMYTWHNFVMGSMMVEVLAADGIIRQPVTFAA